VQGLVNAILTVFPNAQNRWCCKHLYNDFITQFPGVMLRSLFWKAAKCYTSWEYKEAMNEIKKINVEAYTWLENNHPSMWARSTFDTSIKSDHITNNMSESFNNWVG